MAHRYVAGAPLCVVERGDVRAIVHVVQPEVRVLFGCHNKSATETVKKSTE